MRETYGYKRGDGFELEADVYPHPNSGAPVLLFIHGGALIWGSRESIMPEQVELYRQAGFTIVSIDYRMAPETRLELIVDDVRDAVIWVRDRYRGKMAWSGTAGGYLALLSGSFTVKPDAIVSFYGYGDITEDWYNRPSEFYRR